MNKVAYTLAGQAKSARRLVYGSGPHCRAGLLGGRQAEPDRGGRKGRDHGAGNGRNVRLGTAGTGFGGSTPPIGGIGGIVTNPDSGIGCQHTQYTFDPKIPTVYLVVDRSGSMFHCLSATPERLPQQGGHVVVHAEGRDRVGHHAAGRAGPLRVHDHLRDRSRNNRGGMCPLITGTLADNVPPALNNASRHQGEVRRPRVADRERILDAAGRSSNRRRCTRSAAAAKALTADSDAR